MITCDFFGGLGNNLFQLATAYAIHKKYGYELQIPSVVSRGNIGVFGQETELEFTNLFDNEFAYNNYLNLPRYTHPDTDLASTDYTYTEIPVTDNTCYSGYFQSEKYFMGVDISKELKLNSKVTSEILDHFSDLYSKKTISLHYRLGGDRVQPHMQHYHKNVSVEFYKKALSSISDYSESTHNILVFSDNMSLCRELLKDLNYPLTYVQNASNIIHFIMMSLCDINIVGNSTFSWWAAYMNQKEHKKVIATQSEWFGPGYSHCNLKDTFPQSWIKL